MESSVGTLPLWSAEKSKICARLRGKKSQLKIVLKTKDESFFLRKWISHHAQIVGADNLVIFDNGSEDPDVLATYEEFRSRIEIVRFDDFHNNLHRVEQYQDLYDALRESCSYYCFLDTDEYLAWVNDDLTVAPNSAILEKITSSGAAILPGTWLENAMGYYNRVWINLELNHLVSGLKSGKPMLSSSLPVRGMINHNRQVPFEMYQGSIPTNLIVIHLKRLSPKQRIQTNYRKLIAYKALKKGEPVETVLAIDAEAMPAGNKRTWIKEIQRFWQADEPVIRADQPLQAGVVEFTDDQKIRFSDDRQKDAFSDFIRNSGKYVLSAFEAKESD